MHKVRIAPNAARDLDRIREPDLERIRVGNWRVLYGIEDQEKAVTVLRVLRRSEKTYKR